MDRWRKGRMIGLRDKDFLLPARGKTCSGSDLSGDVAGAVAAATIAAAAMTTNDSGLTSQQQEQQDQQRRLGAVADDRCLIRRIRKSDGLPANEEEPFVIARKHLRRRHIMKDQKSRKNRKRCVDKGDRLAPIVAPPLRKRKIASSKVEDPPSIKRMTRSQCAAEAEHSSQIYCQVNTSTPPTIRRSAGIVGPFRSSYLRPLAFPGPPNSNGVSRTLFSFSPLRPQSAGVYTA